MGNGDVRTINEEDDGENTEEEKALNDQDDIKVALWVTLTAAGVDETRTLDLSRDGDACITVITLESCSSVGGV